MLLEVPFTFVASSMYIPASSSSDSMITRDGDCSQPPTYFSLSIGSIRSVPSSSILYHWIDVNVGSEITVPWRITTSPTLNTKAACPIPTIGEPYQREKVVRLLKISNYVGISAIDSSPSIPHRLKFTYT